jgi:hypothetical protein
MSVLVTCNAAARNRKELVPAQATALPFWEGR